MDTTLLIAGLWVAFGASHVALSSRALRPKLVSALGAPGFLGAYSALALALFVPLVWTYVAHRHEGPYLGSLLGVVPGMRWIMYVGMGFAFALVAGGIARSSPASIVPGEAEVGGVFHVTRHPLFMGVAIFGLLHLGVVALHATELAFFAGFPIFGLVGTRHQDARKLHEGDPRFRRFHGETTWLPSLRPAALVAAVRGQPVAVAIGVAATVGARWLHPTLFGVG